MSSDKPLVFWTSSPALPGDTVLVYGTGLTQTRSICLARMRDSNPGKPGSYKLPPKPVIISATPFQPSESSVKFVLPETAKSGIFALWVETPEARSEPVYLNRPDVWWCQGDAGVEASPGGWVRVFGNILGWGRKPTTTMLLQGPETIPLMAQSDGNAVKVELPKAMLSGEYTVYLHNGYGGPLGWSEPLKINVIEPESWPANSIDVKDFGARGDGVSDDTQAIEAALHKAKQDGGGIIYFPRGGYKLNATLTIPPRTVLRGKRRDLSHLFWSNPNDNRLDAVILGTNHFGIEDLTLTFAGANNGIIADIPCEGTVTNVPGLQINDEAGDVFLRRVTMRWLLYSGHMKICDANTILTETTSGSAYGALGFLLVCGGKNITICDCNLYSSGNLFNLVGSTGGLVAHNRMFIGRCGWANFDGCDGITCEDNVFTGADNMVRSGITFWSILPMRNMYFAGNEIDNVYFNDREGMTTDGASGKYFGSIVSATRTSVTLPIGTTFTPDKLRDHLCFVVSGTGQGQSRIVIENTDTMFTVNHPWDVMLESDSLIGINHTVTHFLIVGNVSTDVGVAFQFYGTAMHSIVSGNRCIRAKGFRSHAGRYPGGSLDLKDNQPQFFVQYLDNEIIEGMTPMFTNNDSTGALVPSEIGITSYAGQDSTLARTWPLALGLIFRRNKLNSSARISVLADPKGGEPAQIKDVIIERNSVSCSDVGVLVSKWTAGVVIRKNTFNDVDLPLSGDGLSDAFIET